MTGGAQRESGVTIIELLVAMISASVLAITAGIILVFCFRTLRSNGDVIGLQRDVDATTRTLYRTIRGARRNQISTPDEEGATGPQLTIGTRSFYRASADLTTVNPNGANLVFDPNTGVNGDEQVLVNGTLQDCTFRHNTNCIALSLTVAAQYDRIQIDSDIRMRNEL
jgi:type II secretory pathway component PulJ